MNALESTPQKTVVHLCLLTGSEEAKRNMDAFLRAVIHVTPEFRSRVIICSDADSLQLAQELAMQSKKVMLVNGANRKLLGNHWFGRGANRQLMKIYTGGAGHWQ